MKHMPSIKIVDLSVESCAKLDQLSHNEAFDFATYLFRMGVTHSIAFTDFAYTDSELFDIWLSRSKKMERMDCLGTRQEYAFPLHIKPYEMSFANLSEKTLDKIREADPLTLRKLVTSLIRRDLPHVNVPEELYIEYLFKEYT